MNKKFKGTRTKPLTDDELCTTIHILKGHDYIDTRTKHNLVLVCQELLDRRNEEEVFDVPPTGEDSGPNHDDTEMGYS